MLGSEIRQSFLDFFEQRGHLVIPSASLVPHGDPTLMFTNAGMVQFKEVFLGDASAAAPRVVDSQKCLRLSGKHNDLEEVGRDTYHHTLFEMLGNWSFGDYYKAEAIEWAWELITDVWGLPEDKLYATVYRSDEEAARLWKKISGLDDSRVLRFDEKDNFWEMGATGPCGPCSEIHIDRGPASCDMKHLGDHRCKVNGGCARYIELWNLVFIQHQRDEQGLLHDLPQTHVDTGMGLERIASVLEGVDDNYEGSLFTDLIERAEEMSGREYGGDPEGDVSFRVVADHGRAVSFMIADGIAPSNEGRGYVLRRLVRRAARHGKNLGLDSLFLFRICEAVVESMGEAYPELAERREAILEGVRGEEERFALTLDRGLVHLDQALDELGAKKKSVKSLPGEVAFRLYDTYGFPLDMTEDILRSRGMSVDLEGFHAALEEQRARARDARALGRASVDFTLLVATAREKNGSRFAGPFVAEAESEIIALASGGRLVDGAVEGDEVEIVTALTPFYAESGGQVGDVGTIVSESGSTLEVVDAQKAANDVTVHLARVTAGELRAGETVKLRIDDARRQAIRLNHSATHLLHAALRNHLGEGVKQAGSLVDESHLRFDFSHDGAVADEKLADIETEVNAAIRDNLEITVEEMPFQEALDCGALAFFGEKYGDLVRVVRMGDYSVELCGGTHARRSGDIGLLRLSSESAVGAGLRRVEARSGETALREARERDALLRRFAGALRGNVDDAFERLEKLISAHRELKKQLSKRGKDESGEAMSRALAGARPIDGGQAVIARVDGVEAAALRLVSDGIRDRLGSAVVVLAGEVAGGVAMVVAVTADLTGRFHAGKIVKRLVPIIDGRGGGKPDFAQAGGKNAEGIGSMLEKANELIV
ncbi:MAG: alanine--tRNA ligase [Candidatus Binatia bacterium]